MKVHNMQRNYRAQLLSVCHVSKSNKQISMHISLEFNLQQAVKRGAD